MAQDILEPETEVADPAKDMQGRGLVGSATNISLSVQLKSSNIQARSREQKLFLVLSYFLKM